MNESTPLDLELNEDARDRVIPVNNGVRFGNFIIDRIVSYAISYGIMYLIVMYTDFYLLGTSIGINLLFAFSLYFFYYFIMEAMTQRTIGKYLTGTMVVMEDGSKPTTQAIAIRTLCRFIPFEQFSFFGTRGWHDSISKTSVVSSRKIMVG